MTNFEYIKNMTVEELAKWLQDGRNECNCCIFESDFACPNICIYGVKQWLEREVKKNDGKTV